MDISNQEKVDKVLNKMSEANSEQDFTEGLNILAKLIHNIISNPFQPKYRTVKITNNTIKSKIMNLKYAQDLLQTLGYVLQNQEVYVLRDQQIGDFLEGSPAVDYRRRLMVAKGTSAEAYQKQKELIKIHKQQAYQKLIKQKEIQRMKNQCNADKAQRKHMKVDDSKSNTLKFGANSNTFKDIGIDLCAQNKG